jgi:hypothetical protein
MIDRNDLVTALFVLTLGCGGKTPTGSAAVDSGSTASPDASASGSGSGSSSGSNSGGSSGSGSGDDSGGDGDSASPADGEIPDASPGSCGPFASADDPDGAPGMCGITPADVACTTDADCTSYSVARCGCVDPVYGVNKASTAGCIPPPCTPPIQACAPDASGLETEDCQLVQDPTQVGVACVNHQCTTFARGSK